MTLTPAMATLTWMPDEFRAGETVSFELTLPDFPPASCTLVVALRGVSAADGTVVENASTYTVTFTAAATAALAPGVYQWAAMATGPGGVVTQAASGVVRVLQNLVTAAAGAAQSHAEQMVVILEAAIEALVSGKVQSYQIHARSVTYTDLAELRKMLAAYRAELRAEMGGGPFQDIHAVFTRPTTQ